MIAKNEYLRWLNSSFVGEDTKNELQNMNEGEIEESFYKMLDFGTGGLRGVLGAGTNRLNIYTLRQCTQGVSSFIVKEGAEWVKKGVVIAYDSRRNSDVFAKEAARVLAGNGIKAYLFDKLTSTPELSFAVRALKATAGIVITASHNPAKYNGYKVYWDDGGQLPPHFATKVYDEMIATDILGGAKLCDFNEGIQKGLIEMVGEKIDQQFLDSVYNLMINKELIRNSDLKVVYTPFHGTGNVPVTKVLNMAGLKSLFIVKEQQMPDPNFSTVKSPNPEDKEGFYLAIDLAKNVGADLILGTDPDCDRVGVLVRDKSGEFNVLTGNQVGILLTHYVLSQLTEKKLMPKNPIVVKTIVTSEMVTKICESFNVAIVDVLTGFKFIGEKIKEFETTHEYNYVFGFEESYGYLSGTHARDKDAVNASLLITEMAAYYKEKNMNLCDALFCLYDKYGYYMEDTVSVVMEGLKGLEAIEAIMERLHAEHLKAIGEFKVVAVSDYLSSEKTNLITGEKTKLTLPESDVLYYELSDGSIFVIRPSGTEPKIKTYVMTVANSFAEVNEKLEVFRVEIKRLIK